jgi:hypothetical protein
MFTCCIDFGKYGKAAETAEQYFQANPGSPLCYLMQLGFYYVIALPDCPAKQRMKCAGDIQEARDFLRTYGANHPVSMHVDEEKWLQSLPQLLEQRGRQLQSEPADGPGK